MYVNGKMIPVETIPGMRGRGIKENGRGGEFKYDIFCIHFCKCYDVPPPNTTIRKKKNQRYQEMNG
jgi:hypothetical protein